MTSTSSARLRTSGCAITARTSAFARLATTPRSSSATSIGFPTGTCSFSKASQKLTPGFEEVFYNAWNGFTFQYPLILAAISPADDDETFARKRGWWPAGLTSSSSRRMVNYRNFGYSTVSYTMFNHVKDIRDLDVAELAQVLGTKVAEMEDGFDTVANLGSASEERKSDQVPACSHGGMVGGAMRWHAYLR